MIVPFAHTEIYEGVKFELVKESVWHKDIGENKIEILKDSFDSVINVSKKVSATLLPKERSMSLAKNLHAKVLSKLKELGVRYETKCFDKSVWLIWEENDTTQVNEIIDEITQSTDPTTFGGLNTCT